MEKIIAEGLETPYEIGPGKTLSGMMRRIDRGARVSAINSVEAIEKVLG
jgi:[acyl-carrier-protein] S-malonyltransferase